MGKMREQNNSVLVNTLCRTLHKNKEEYQGLKQCLYLKKGLFKNI